MVESFLHSWEVSFQEAVAIQNRLAQKVCLRTSAKLKKRLHDPNLLVAGADISYDRGSPLHYAVIVVSRLKDLSVVERAAHRMEVSFPYIPGLLSFREVPPLIETFKCLKHKPDILLCDGQGLAHPRRFGLACHLGVWLNLPTIGCAKSRLVGSYRKPGEKKGHMAKLMDRGEVVGRVVRTRRGVKPVFVSIGHQINLDDAVRLVLECAPRYRIPEPIREAHMTVNYIRRSLD